MSYKIRHKGKSKEPSVLAGMKPLLVQLLVIVAALIVAIMLPKHTDKGDPVITVALVIAAAGGVLAGLTRIVQAVLGERARSPRGEAVLAFFYRASFVLAASGLIAAFYRTIFR